MWGARRVVSTTHSDRWNVGDHRIYKKLLKGNGKVQFRKSPVGGFGLFLLEDAPPGTNVNEYTGERYSLEEVEYRYTAPL